MYKLRSLHIAGNISSDHILKGVISSENNLIGNAETTSKLTGKIVLGVSNTYKTYEGQTVVIPSAHSDQVLSTSNKLVIDDITIKTIPYSEVTNLSDGITVTIA